MALEIPGTRGGPPLTMRAAHKLTIGDLLDLAGDPYADPNSRNAHFGERLVEVLDVEQDGETSIKIRWSFGELRFPIDHELLVVED